VALALPRTKDVLDLVELLIGEQTVFEPGESWDLSRPGPGCYITFLQGKTMAIEGAIITDLAATLYIGGKLILLPEATLLDQAMVGAAQVPVIEAVTEVVNNLRTLFNNIRKNPHVAPTKTFPYQVPSAGDYVAWLLHPSERMDHVGDTPFGRAHLTLLVR
jgi:hypothetical protein